MRENPNSQEVFMALTQKASQMVEELKAHIDDHFEVSPDKVHWGHVGTAGKTCEDLEALLAFLGVRK